MMNDQLKFGSRVYEPNAISTLKFEIKSLIGRSLSPRRRVPKSSFLHLGCGDNIQEGFENLDFYSMRHLRHLLNSILSRTSEKSSVAHDLRFPLPYADHSFDGAFSEHTLEHLCASQAKNLLREVHRVLKPAATFRIVVPDLEQYVKFYLGNNNTMDFKKFESGCEAIWCLTQNWGHLSCWDAKMLTSQLLFAGFKSANKVSFRVGLDERLLLDLIDRRWESLYVEGIA